MTNPPKQWCTQVASDVIRDGLGVELIDSNDQVVAEVFRCDSDHTLSLSVFVDALPLQAVEFMIYRAKERLDPFEDGVPLSEANHYA